MAHPHSLCDKDAQIQPIEPTYATTCYTGDMLDPTHLQYFLATVEHGSITQAARELGVSQPSLSVAIRNLEEHLGTTLFFRERTGVRLTSSGEELVRAAREIFTLMTQAEGRIRGIEKDETGTFSIGCHESLGSYVLPSFLKNFIASFPKVELTLQNATSEATLRAVLEGRLHFGLVMNPHPHPDLVLVNLFEDVLDVLVATEVVGRIADAPAAQQSAMDLLRHGPLIYVTNMEPCDDLMNQLAAVGLLPPRTLPCGDLELAKSLALAGIGPALLPRRVARYGQLGKLIRLHPSLPVLAGSICLAYRADIHKTTACMRLKDALVTHCRSLEQGPSMTTVSDA